MLILPLPIHDGSCGTVASAVVAAVAAAGNTATPTTLFTGICRHTLLPSAGISMRIVMVVFIFKEPELKYADAEEQGKEYI